MDYDYEYVDQTPTLTIAHGQNKLMTVRLRNTGTQTWQQTGTNPVHLATVVAGTTTVVHSALYTAGDWVNDREIAMQETSVAPNDIATFQFVVTPNIDLNGKVTEHLRPVVSGITWMKNINMSMDVIVPARVGVFFFNWYGPNGEHWEPTAHTAVVDTPKFGTVNGPYDSADVNVIRQQLDLIRDAGIDFVALDWWESELTIRANALQVADLIIAEYPELSFTFFIEPNGQFGADWQNHLHPISQADYNFFYDTYNAEPQFMRWAGKPYLLTFTPRIWGTDTRFNVSAFSFNYSNYPNYWADPPQIKNRILAITARYDDRALIRLGRSGTAQAKDPTYAELMLEQQTQYALSQRDNTDILMLTAWNEHHERTNFEPHTNPDSTVPADYALQHIKDFINNRWKQ